MSTGTSVSALLRERGAASWAAAVSHPMVAEIGAATNKINHDLRNMLSTARLLSDRLARSDDQRTRALAPTILNTIDRAARLASDAIEYVRDRPTPRIAEIELADLVD